MTTEQKEAIDRLNYINRAYDLNNYYSNYDLDCIDVVLNLIQEQEAELKKKEKIIDELAKAFKQDDVRSVEEIKEYFEELAKEEGE